MAKHREHIMEVPGVYWIGNVQVATVESDHGKVRIMMADEEWLSGEELLERAKRRRKQLAAERRNDKS